MGAQHTPGPWIYYADLPITDPNWHIVTTANKMRVVANIHIEPGNAMDKANARLVAAAPDMLEALKSIREWSPFLGAEDAPCWALVENAIAKAEGRTA